MVRQHRHERLLAEFPEATLDQWHAEVVKLLKGAPFEKKMLTPTYEGITLKALYTQDDIRDLSFPAVMPGDSPYPRSTRVLGFREGAWLVAQELPYPTYEELNEALRQDLERGQTAVNLLLDRATQAGLDPDMAAVGEVGADGTSIASVIGLSQALEGVDLERVPILVQPGSAALPFAALLVALLRRQGKDPAGLRGSLGMDPLAGLVTHGELPLSLGRAWDELALLTGWASSHAPRVTTVSAYGFPYHESGASAVQELAFALATAVEHLRQLEERGLDVETVAPRILFGLSVGSHFFMEVAKLRAARMLWAQVVQAAGGSAAAARMTLHARSSSWNKTRFDPHTNILRATTEAFAAVLGGATPCTWQRSTRPLACPRSRAGASPATPRRSSARRFISTRLSTLRAAPGPWSPSPPRWPRRPGCSSSNSRRRAACWRHWRRGCRSNLSLRSPRGAARPSPAVAT